MKKQNEQKIEIAQLIASLKSIFGRLKLKSVDTELHV